LGVTGLWLMPVMRSPSYHGYDVLNYLDINPNYGTMDDMRELIDEAHARGMVVIIDMIFNHTSRAHPWFSRSAQQQPGYADYYVWSDTDPGFRGPDNQQVWHPYAGRSFYGLFSSSMPDLNLLSEDVTAEIHEIARFWLEDVGVDGFRLDAVKHYVEEGSDQENTASTHAWTTALNAYVHGLVPEALLIGEVWSNTYDAAPYVADGELNLVFEFDFAQAILDAAGRGDPAGVVTLQQRLIDQYPLGQYASFLANHDQNRVMSVLRNDAGQARVAAATLLTAPGVPFLYYGEEIGMTGVKPDERIRTPMQWDDTPVTAGFTDGRSTWQPLSESHEAGVSVAAQDADPGSLLNFYRSLIHLRNAEPALRQGDWLNLRASNRDVYAFLRRTPEDTLLVLINYTDQVVTDLLLEARAGALPPVTQAEVIFGAATEATIPQLAEDGSFEDWAPIPSLGPHDTVIIRLS
ncbi:MAG TPA: alpha-amylase family glycosyl hydrolase, partial [Candidatus Limnocylindrales bacterium]|nr:alpha-amylase family glycosyl hydrolase [Candidatus Limnocylindrales bacterium]